LQVTLDPFNAEPQLNLIAFGSLVLHSAACSRAAGRRQQAPEMK
jgi:hypothetical protein